MIFGAHMSTSGGFRKAMERGASIRCGVVQIFVKNNMQWLGRMPAEAEVEAFMAERERGGFNTVFGHTGYLINLGGPDSPNRSKSIESLTQEIWLAEALGLPFLVLHPGAHLGAGEERGLERIVAGLDEVLAATKKAKVRIALENTAGQGSCLGYKIEHLAAIFDAVKSPGRLGVCLDTAHAFAAGFDLRVAEGWETLIGRVESLLGVEQILAFHLNDSKTGLGSRVDRHEHIGRGQIGLEGFRHIVNDARFAEAPGCLETPKSEDMREDVENLATLRSLLKKSQGKQRKAKALPARRK
jgi:deoxyribonuclease-4